MWDVRECYCFFFNFASKLCWHDCASLMCFGQWSHPFLPQVTQYQHWSLSTSLFCLPCVKCLVIKHLIWLESKSRSVYFPLSSQSNRPLNTVLNKSVPPPNHPVSKIFLFSYFKLANSVSLDPRPEYQRVKLSWQQDDPVAVAMTTGSQCSSRLLSLRTANALLELPPRSDSLTQISEGSLVNALIIGSL